MSPDDRIRKKYDLSPPSGTLHGSQQLGDAFGPFQIGGTHGQVDTATGLVTIGISRRSAYPDLNSSSEATITPFGGQPVRPQRK